MRHEIARASFLLLAVATASAQTTTRASVSSSGMQANSFCALGRASDDGRLIVFASPTSNWFAGDAQNGPQDLFAYDRVTGTTVLVSASPTGLPGDNDSSCAVPNAISSDRRWVVFSSYATNLLPPDPVPGVEVFLRDLQTGTTQRVSTTAAGQSANGPSSSASISADGTRVAFWSLATNLVAGDTNGARDVFVKTLTTGAVVRASVSSFGVQASAFSDHPVLSRDGRWIAFTSWADNLVPADTNGLADVFLHDVQTGTTTRISTGSGGVEADAEAGAPTISGDGTRIAWDSAATNLVLGDTNGKSDVFLHDTTSGLTTRVSVGAFGTEGNGNSLGAVLSADGRFVGFTSTSTNFVPDANSNADAFRHDTLTGALELLGVASTGIQGNVDSSLSDLSVDGSVAVLVSNSSNLIAGDSNSGSDIFVRDLTSTYPPITAYCTAKTSSIGCVGRLGSSGTASAGVTDSFRLLASNLPPGLNGIFFWGRAPLGAPFLGGTLCVQPPLVRTPVTNTSSFQGGSPTCHGATTYVLTQAEMAAQGIAAGETIYAQFWFRDSGFTPPNNVAFTDAISFFVAP